MFAFDIPRSPRRPSLTPMIDVVFLLLVFFMLASRFGMETSLPLHMAGQGASETYSGPPRLIDILPEELRLNGVPVAADQLVRQIEALTQTRADTIVLRAREGARLQGVVDVMQRLEQAGFTALVLVE